MLFAAVAHAKYGLPTGALASDELTIQDQDKLLSDLPKAIDNLKFVNDLLSSDRPPTPWAASWSASKSTTQRIASRRIRFPVYLRALTPAPLEP